MKLELADGKYVVGVSGGVDSVVLLDILAKWLKTEAKNSEIIVAHFDHGIRPDSTDDALFVEKLARSYKFSCILGHGELGSSASEDQSREARYGFLRQVSIDTKAKAIITAHHQDDVLETAILNILRGTNRRGISALKSTDELSRPLLEFPKSTLVDYAKANRLVWHEDSTNTDQKYRRNYVRHSIVPKLSHQQRTQMLRIISAQATLNSQIDFLLDSMVSEKLTDNDLPRLWLASLDSKLSKEIIAAWLRQNNIYGYDHNILNRLDSELKVGKVNSRVSALSGRQIRIGRDNLALEPIER